MGSSAVTHADEAPRSSSPPPPPWSAPLTTITLAHTPMHAYLADFEAESEARPPEEAIAEPVPDSPTTAAFMNALGGSSGNDQGQSTGEGTNSDAAVIPLANNLPREPDSPPPEFRSRPPTPERQTASASEEQLAHAQADDREPIDAGWPDIDPDAIVEAERGYASSENELDLLSSQGRNLSAVGEGVLVSDSEGEHDDGSRARREQERRRWQLRHWEAWRREGLDMEGRLKMLASVQKKAKEEAQASRMARARTAPVPVSIQTAPAAEVRSALGESPPTAPMASASQQMDSSVSPSSAPPPAIAHTLPALQAVTPRSPASPAHAPRQLPALTVQRPQVATTSVQEAADPVVVGSSLSQLNANAQKSSVNAAPAHAPIATPPPVSPSATSAAPNGHAPLQEHRQLSPSGIRESLSGRFPSIGSVRRARLKRFDAERQTSKTLGSVIETSPTSSGVQPPRSFASNSGGLSPATVASSLASAPQTSAVALPSSAWSESRPLGRVPSATSAPAATPAEPASTAETEPRHPATESAGRRPVSQLVKQLTANFEARPSDESKNVSQSSTSRSAQSLAQVASNAGPSGSLAQRSASAQEQAQLVPVPAVTKSRIQSEVPYPPPDAASEPSRTTKRVAKLRKEGGRTGRKPAETGERFSSGQRRAFAARMGVPEEEPSVPEMILPRAPPRVTSDPLSMDNLRKLSRHQERSPSLNSTESPSSSSGGDAEEVTSLSSPEESKSDSDSDSADEDSATHKPASSLVSLPSGVGPPSTSNSTVHGYDGQKEMAAASWRRTEDGKRHSAILSRPLSIKRKPPPVPAKRWGGIWESTSVQENLAKTLRLFDERPELASRNDARTMPGALSGVAEADEDANHWETVGQPVQPLSVQPRLPNFAWETAGRDDDSNAPVLAQLAASATTRALSFLGLDGSQGFSAAAPPVPTIPHRHIQPVHQYPEARRLPPVPPHPATAARSAAFQVAVPDRDPFISENDRIARRLPPALSVSGQTSAAPALPSRPASIRSIGPSEPADDETFAQGNPFADLTPPRAQPNSADGPPGRARSPSGSLLQRSGATRRPQSLAYPSLQWRSSDMTRSPSSPSASNPPNETVRATLNNRPRHVYSSSVPNATLSPSSPQRERPRSRRPLPIPPISEDSFTGLVAAANEQSSIPLTNDTPKEPADAAKVTSPPQEQSDVTDLEVMIAQMEDRGTENVSPMPAVGRLRSSLLTGGTLAVVPASRRSFGYHKAGHCGRDRLPASRPRGA